MYIWIVYGDGQQTDAECTGIVHNMTQKQLFWCSSTPKRKKKVKYIQAINNQYDKQFANSTFVLSQLMCKNFKHYQTQQLKVYKYAHTHTPLFELDILLSAEQLIDTLDILDICTYRSFIMKHHASYFKCIKVDWIELPYWKIFLKCNTK